MLRNCTIPAKHSYSLILALIVLSTAQAQEFTPHGNGLIYDTSTIRILRKIVDSLHLKFKYCDPSRTYYSMRQAHGRYVYFKSDTDDLLDIKSKMDRGIPYDILVRDHDAYVQTKEQDIIVMKHKDVDYRWNKSIDTTTTVNTVEFFSLPNQQRIANDYSDDLLNKQHATGEWVYSYYHSDYRGDHYSLSAFYFTSDFQRQPLDERYARLVQYSDCLVDTTTQIFIRVEESAQGDFEEFLQRVRQLTEYPSKPEYSDSMNGEVYYQTWKQWNHDRWAYIDSTVSPQSTFREALREAAEIGIRECCSDEELEKFVSRYLSKELALALKRRRRVVGGCSMDERPREHAFSIAMLAAETAQWEVFLRAHLDIMNDRFERMTDGSYAWAGRKTYIRELEELDINVLDLLFGISFSIDNPSQNHYAGSIGRLGRALAETKYRDEFEAGAYAMIQDPALDDLNRIRIYFLYVNYLFSLPDQEVQRLKLQQLKDRIHDFPSYLHSEIQELKLDS